MTISKGVSVADNKAMKISQIRRSDKRDRCAFHLGVFKKLEPRYLLEDSEAMRFRHICGTCHRKSFPHLYLHKVKQVVK